VTEIQQIKNKLEEFRGLCGDHGCIFGGPSGMGTNATCRCELRNPKVRQGILLMRRLIHLYETEMPRTDREIFFDNFEDDTFTSLR